jgi:hypothetical protein
MKQCPVTFHSGNLSTLYYLADNEYVISTWGDTLEARCTGKNAQITSIQKGTFHIVLPPSCSLSSPTWTISALSLHHLNFHLVSLQLPRPNALNFSSLIDPSRLSLPILSPQQTMRGLAPIPLADLQQPYLEPLKIDAKTSHFARDMLIAISLTLTIVLGVYFLYKQRVHCCQVWCQ